MKKLLSLALCLALVLGLTAVSASAAEVVPSPQNLTVDGKAITCEKYNIDGSNYFKLRDIAMLLNETPYSFAVEWDPVAKSVIIAPGFPYVPDGSELKVGADQSGTARISAQTIWYLDAPVDDLTVYNIGGNNYFQLRELGTLIGFDVAFDKPSNTAMIRTVPASNAKAEAFGRLWSWIEENADRDIVGKEYFETRDFEGGDSAMFSLIDTEDNTIAVVLTYVYAASDYDRTWIYLNPNADDYYAVYSYYADGDEAGFTGTLELDPESFDAAKSTEFFDVEGELTGLPGYDFWGAASTSFAYTLSWLQDIYETVPALSGAGVYDFGFTDAGLDYMAQIRAAAAQVEAYDFIFAWAEDHVNDVIDGYPAFTKQELLVGLGATTTVSVVPAVGESGEALALDYTYTYETGDMDRAYIFLGPESQYYYAGYEHYAPGADEPDFYGSFTVDAAGFTGSYPAYFDEIQEDGAADGFDVSARYLAVYSLCDLLVQFDELCRLTISPAGDYDITDFGFSTARLSTAELALH